MLYLTFCVVPALSQQCWSVLLNSFVWVQVKVTLTHSKGSTLVMKKFNYDFESFTQVLLTDNSLALGISSYSRT